MLVPIDTTWRHRQQTVCKACLKGNLLWSLYLEVSTAISTITSALCALRMFSWLEPKVFKLQLRRA